MHNSFGHRFAVTLSGSSHSDWVAVRIEGVAPGIALSTEDFTADLARRRAGAPGTTARTETDTPEITSGVDAGHTTGAPINIRFRNANTLRGDYVKFADHPRPSHADLVARRKYGAQYDASGGGIASGRMTVALVAAGVVAKKLLPGVSFATRIMEIGGVRDEALFDDIIKEVSAAGDSVGGVVETIVTGVDAGVGEPFFDSVESVAAHLLFSIPGVKGVEFGAGFAAAARRGSTNNDLIVAATGRTATNNDGGVNGGIANGNPLLVRVAFRPAASIALPQRTFDFRSGSARELAIGGRHDACIAIRGAVVVESVLAIALAELYGAR